ncbi:MAG: hypothetical protein AB7N76_09950 [Planctomycetota bacterium]
MLGRDPASALRVAQAYLGSAGAGACGFALIIAIAQGTMELGGHLPWAIPGLLGAVGALHLGAVHGLRGSQEWARRLALGLAVLSLPLVPVGTALGGFLLALLQDERVRARFAFHSGSVTSSEPEPAPNAGPAHLPGAGLERRMARAFLLLVAGLWTAMFGLALTFLSVQLAQGALPLVLNGRPQTGLGGAGFVACLAVVWAMGAALFLTMRWLVPSPSEA